MNECRCRNCKKLLFKYKNNVRINLEIKCSRCNEINQIQFEDDLNDLKA